MSRIRSPRIANAPCPWWRNFFNSFAGTPDRLPESYRDEAQSRPIHYVVCDYLAGMTDAFFLRTFEAMIVP
ncbi:MAG: hypothetical protein WDO73_33010 [Ignavibacteriota bacterium]